MLVKEKTRSPRPKVIAGKTGITSDAKSHPVTNAEIASPTLIETKIHRISKYLGFIPPISGIIKVERRSNENPIIVIVGEKKKIRRECQSHNTSASSMKEVLSADAILSV